MLFSKAVDYQARLLPLAAVEESFTTCIKNQSRIIYNMSPHLSLPLLASPISLPLVAYIPTTLFPLTTRFFFLPQFLSVLCPAVRAWQTQSEMRPLGR